MKPGLLSYFYDQSRVLWNVVNPAVKLDRFDCIVLALNQKYEADSIPNRTVIVLGDHARDTVGLESNLIHPVEKDGIVWRQLPDMNDAWYDNDTHKTLVRMLLEELGGSHH